MRVGIAQIEVQSGALSANLGTALEAVRELATHGAEVVILPETFDLGWCCPDSRALARPDRVLFELSRVANSQRVYLVAGYTELAEDQVFNASALIGPDGDVLLRHRKFNELDFALDVYAQGSALPGVVETSFGRVSIPICADSLDPRTFPALAKQGAQYVLSPCAWAVPPEFDNDKTPYGDLWRNAYGVGAGLGMSVVGVSNVGEVEGGLWDGHPVIGASIAVLRDRAEFQAPYGSAAHLVLSVD